MARTPSERAAQLLLTTFLVAVSVDSLAQNANMGADYNALEALALRIETHFRDGCIATTQRTTSAVYTTEARWQGDTGDDTLLRTSYSVESKQLTIDGLGLHRRSVVIPAGFVPSLDWLNPQACSLLADVRDIASQNGLPSSELAWTGSLYRHQSQSAQSPRTMRDMSSRTVTIIADFPSERVSTAVLDSSEAPSQDAFVWESTVTARSSGASVGRVRWSESRQALQFSYPGLTRDAVITPENLGRPFDLDFNPAWGMVQAFAFKHYLELRRTNLAHSRSALGLVASNSGGAPLVWQTLTGDLADVSGSAWPASKRTDASRSAATPIGTLTLSGTMQIPPDPLNDGCTYLWYLNFIFRPCCDEHDKCYQYGQCDSISWWTWEFFFHGPGWYCTTCNVAVAYCFYDTVCNYMGGLACI